MDSLTKEMPWYAAGLAFECQECGGCCSGPEEGYVWATDDEIAAMAEYLKISEAEMRSRYVRKVGRRQSLKEDKKTKDCLFLQPDGNGGKKCTIYPVRPIQCRTWPFWDSNLQSPEDWTFAGVRCPGINRGKQHELKEIVERRNATRE